MSFYARLKYEPRHTDQNGWCGEAAEQLSFNLLDILRMCQVNEWASETTWPLFPISSTITGRGEKQSFYGVDDEDDGGGEDRNDIPGTGWLAASHSDETETSRARLTEWRISFLSASSSPSLLGTTPCLCLYVRIIKSVTWWWYISLRI